MNRRIMDAEFIASALGGHKVGLGWLTACLVHDDREPSLSIRDGTDGKVLVHCHAGCDQRKVIAALRRRGLWASGGRRRSRVMGPPRAVSDQANERDAKRGAFALAYYDMAQPASGTLVATYLASRGICLPPPETLRLHIALRHPTGGLWPAMVGLVTYGPDGTPLGIHRTFLARDGGGKAPVAPQKMMLGPCSGGAVRLREPGDLLMVGEGIETCLAAMQETGHPAWAALSTSGLRTLELPQTVHEVIVLADGDDAGEAAALHCARRLRQEGRRVRIARPPRGMDFNDLLLGRNPGTAEVGR